MKNNHVLITSTIAGVVAATLSLAANAAPEQPTAWGKCAGIAAQGKNNCGALDGSRSCVGQATASNEAAEWVYVPKGTCEKLTGRVVGK